MAVLFRSGDNYKAIGFYMPHENLKDDPDKKTQRNISCRLMLWNKKLA